MYTYQFLINQFSFLFTSGDAQFFVFFSLAVMPRAVMLICSGGDASGWWYPLIVAPAVLSTLRTFRWRNVSPCCEGEGILMGGILHVGLINLFKHGSWVDFMLDGDVHFWRWCHLAGMPRAGMLKLWRGCHGLGCHRAVMLIVLPVWFELCSLRMIWTYMRLGIMTSKAELPIAYLRHPKIGGVCLEYAMWLMLR